jgi:hypothetical protein
MDDKDLDTLETELTQEKRALALELAQGNFANHDRYDRLAQRLRFLGEARAVPASVAVAAPVAAPSKQAPKDKG